MRWSWHIANAFGIGIYLHFTFLLLPALFVLPVFFVGDFTWQESIIAAANRLGLLVALFTIVVLHELGHALTARRFGIETRDIMLLPIGGLARLERMPEEPKEEFLVAIAGPAVNFVLAILAAGGLALLYATQGLPDGLLRTLGGATLMGFGSFLFLLFYVNVFMGGFNLLPGFPMDGGRILRALIATRLPYMQATQVAAKIGQGMGILFLFVGLAIGNIFLMFIGVFVFIVAGQEASMVQLKVSLEGIRVSDAMLTEYHTLRPDDALDVATDHIIAGFQQDFPVVDESDRVVGVLTRSDLLKNLAERGENSLVRHAMTEEFETAGPDEMLDQVFYRLQNCDCRVMPVVRKDQLVGIMNMENLGEFVALQSAIHGGGAMGKVAG